MDRSDVPAADGPVEADKAMELLLHGEGICSRANRLILIRDSGFDPLRGRDDFQKLIQDLETSTKPAGK